MTAGFLEETPSRTRERILDVLLAVKSVRGSAHDANVEMLNTALTGQGFSWRKEGNKVHYMLHERKGNILTIDVYKTRYLDTVDPRTLKRQRGPEIVMMEYNSSNSIGYIELDNLDQWIEHYQKSSFSGSKSEESAA